MLITLAVIAGLTVLVVPRLGNGNSSKLRAAASIVMADLGYLQTLNLTNTDQRRMFVLTSDGLGYHLALQASPTTPINHPITKAPHSVTFGQGRFASLSGVSVSAYSLGGDERLSFGTFGQLDQSANATITLTCGVNHLVITIDALTGDATAGNIQ